MVSQAPPYECVVIGGGPAGLTAAIYLARFRRRVLVIDAGFSRADWIPKSHNLPGFPNGVEGRRLLLDMRRQAGLYGAELKSGRVDRLAPGSEGFVVQAEGDEFPSKTLLLASGVEEVAPAIAGFTEAAQSGVIRVCPICDGFESLGLAVAVLGVGEHAAREALFLRTYTERISLYLTGEEALSPGLRDTLAEAGVEVLPLELSKVRFGAGLDAPASVEGRDFDAVYCAFGVRPRTRLLEPFGLKTAEGGRLLVDEHQETGVRNLFAAGDVVRGLNQISVANGEAAIAATAIHNRLPPVRR